MTLENDRELLKGNTPMLILSVLKDAPLHGYGIARAIDPRIVLLNPNLTLYCLDFESREALFLETPPDCDLTRVPFFYVAQYESALSAVSVPFTLLDRLAEEVVIDPARLILIYSLSRSSANDSEVGTSWSLQPCFKGQS